jgi:uncharacterized protein YndB with AHSA1/START domain
MTVLPTIKPNLTIASPPVEFSLSPEIPPDRATLERVVPLLTHPNLDERIYAAKLIHQMAAMHPQQVAPFLARLLPALDQPGTQTRWMIVRTIGLCAAHDPETAMAALPRVQQFLRADGGAPLWNATLVYLGNAGATSAANASRALPLLEHALDHLPQVTKSIFESLARLLDAADIPTMVHIAEIAAHYAGDVQPGVRASARKVIKRVSDCGLIPIDPISSLSFHHRVQVRAQPPRVYDALTNSGELNCWLTTMSFVDARPGGSIHLRWGNPGANQRIFEDGGPVVQATRPERFTFKRYPHRPDYATTVEIDLQPVEDGTLVRLHERGFEDTFDGNQVLAECSARWVEALAQLKVYLENAG